MLTAHRIAISSILLLVATQEALAHVPDDLQRCAAVANDQARLACYDALARATTDDPAATASVAPAAPSAVTPAAPAVAAAAAAAATPQPVPDRAPAASAPAATAQPVTDQASASFDAVVAKVTRLPTGEFAYTLQDGQRWIQVGVDSRARLEPGATVTIRKAALGSYKLVSGSVATRVRRAQ
jgi:hypothetical protein